MLALSQIAQILGLLALVQGIEFLQMNRAWIGRGPWKWSNLHRELSALQFFLNDKAFYALNCVRVITGVSAMVFPSPWNVGILLFIHVMTVVRWLGSYNGGSDYMTSLLLLFTFMGLWRPETLGSVCLWYMTLQLVLSYFKAGWIKLKNKKWRHGEAIGQFVDSPIYAESRWLRWIFSSPSLSLILSWATIIFEVSFPIAVLNPKIATVYILIGATFHLGNALVFGLNRFVFAWIAAYPALLWCAARG